MIQHEGVMRILSSFVAVSMLAIIGCGSPAAEAEPSDADQTVPIAKVRPESRPFASTQTKQWFQGATLHNATVGQWKAAAYDNKLATAGDWLSATRWKGHLNTPADFDRLKTKANALVKAIDGSLVSGKQLDSLPVNEVAAALVTMSADFGP
jgi:hypothetical protein